MLRLRKDFRTFLKKKKKSLEKFKEFPWRYSNIGHCYSSEISYLKCMGLEKVG